jgi:hypothetical protein
MTFGSQFLDWRVRGKPVRDKATHRELAEMLKYLSTAAVALTLYAPVAWAETRNVVVELFTSQGCSSCPPADELLHVLAEQENVIALALHVDYWDYIGWKDEFARPEHTERQRYYAHAANTRTIYTPQMVIDGIDHVVGARPMSVAKLVMQHSEEPEYVSMNLVRTGDALTVTAEALAAPMGDLVVQLVRYIPSADVEIRQGENAGRTLSYANIVSEWNDVATWKGTKPLSLSLDVAGDNPVVVIVQKANYGEIVGAEILR